MNTASGAGHHLESEDWVTAVYAAPQGAEPLGAGVLLDGDRVLTCAHFVCPQGVVRKNLWVDFPKSERSLAEKSTDSRVRVKEVVTPSGWALGDTTQDAAILVLDKPAPQEAAAHVRLLAPKALEGRSWCAFGFPNPLGDSSRGTVDTALTRGWVSLNTESHSLIRPGYSGAGLWSPDLGAVVGLIVDANEVTARGLTLWQIDRLLPDQELRRLTTWSAPTASGGLPAAWGWTLEHDPEAQRHWYPRARGATSDAENGYRFRGRRTVLEKIVTWITSDSARHEVLVVTGAPGAGKSAVLGRIVTTADPGISEELPIGDAAVRAPLGSVSCAVHAKGKSALEVAAEIARAVYASAPSRVDELVPEVKARLKESGGRRFTLILDALDEAVSPAEARAMASHILQPLAETCGSLGVRVVVGSRRRDDASDAGDLLKVFGTAARVLDLDADQYFEQVDLVDYARAMLQLPSEERHESPYIDDNVATPIAERIAEIAGRNFLVAGLVARAHGLHDQTVVGLHEISFTPTANFALGNYLEPLPAVGGMTVRQALTALAFAEPPGMELGTWRTAIDALYACAPSEVQLREFAHSSAANFLLMDQSADQDGAENFLLFHQALNDVLRADRSDRAPAASDERSLAQALLARGQESGWSDAAGYALRSLPQHAARGRIIDEVLADDVYRLHADLRRLIPAAETAVTAQGRWRARVLRRTPRAINATSNERAALFSVTEACEGMPCTSSVEGANAPYLAMWASVAPHVEVAVLEGHRSMVSAACLVQVNGRIELATGGFDGTVRLWDPSTGEQIRQLNGPTTIHAICVVQVDGRTLLGIGCHDGEVQLWDPSTGEQKSQLNGHTGPVFEVCAMYVNGRSLLASGGVDGTVRLWDLSTDVQIWSMDGIANWIDVLCPFQVGDRSLLAIGTGDYRRGALQLWDPIVDEQTHELKPSTRVDAVCAVQVNGRTMLGVGIRNGEVWLWDPSTDVQTCLLEQGRLDSVRDSVKSVTAVQVDGRTLLATIHIGDDVDSAASLWDPTTGEQTHEIDSPSSVCAVCAVQVDGRTLLATGAEDGTVRLWDPSTIETRESKGHTSSVRASCAVEMDGRTLLATAGHDGAVRLLEPSTGEPIREFNATSVRAMCQVEVGSRKLLAAGGFDGNADRSGFDGDGTVWLWDPSTNGLIRLLRGLAGSIHTVCAVQVDGRTLLAAGGDDGTVRLMNPSTGEQIHRLDVHAGRVYAVCAVQMGDRTLLATGGVHSPVRLWDPHSGEQIHKLYDDYFATSVMCTMRFGGRNLLAAGGYDSPVRLWDLFTGDLTHELSAHAGSVHAVCPIQLRGRTLLATGGDDRTVRLWDLAYKQRMQLEIAVPEPVHAITKIDDLLIVGLSTGVLALKVAVNR